MANIKNPPLRSRGSFVATSGHVWLFFAFASACGVSGCSGSNNSTGTTETGGSSAIGGSPGGGGNGPGGGSFASGGAGAVATGGFVANGGGASPSGGSAQTGGAPSTGGSLASGGTIATGGNTARGGSTATGGGLATGGASSTGGASATGGKTAAGGSSATGGSNATGGRTATGGSVTTGGTNATGGGIATGGTTATGGGTSSVLGATPPMGWNSWNTFGCNVSESLIKSVADTFVSSGMMAAGYQYVNIDDCWMNGRDSNGVLQVNSTNFPDGMAAVANYIHGKGLKIGIYETPNTKTCANIYSGYTGGVGSGGHETTDAQTFASWGIDYLKYDKCTGPLSGFAVMGNALRATGRPIFYSINPGDGSGCPPNTCSINLVTIANMWRIGYDINASWSSITSLIDQDQNLYSYAAPGHWNDPDMMEVGNGSLTQTENQSHFSMWAILAAPLIAGNDVRSMSAATKTILTNTDVIAVDQDPAGNQGRLVATPGTNLQVWSKTLSGTNTRAVALLNRNDSGTASMTVQWTALGIPAGAATVRDLWNHTDLGSFTNSYTASSVPSHGVVMLKIVSSQ